MAATIRSLISVFPCIQASVLHDDYVAEGRNLILHLPVIADHYDRASVGVEILRRGFLDVVGRQCIEPGLEHLQKIASQIIGIDTVDASGHAGLTLQLERESSD